MKLSSFEGLHIRAIEAKLSGVLFGFFFWGGQTKDDETALHCAAQFGHTEVVSALLEKNCDPGIRNSRGETALELAAQYGR